MDWIVREWPWLVAAAAALGLSILLTRKVELRPRRWPFLIACLAVVAFIWVTVRVNTIAGIVLLCVAVRPFLAAGSVVLRSAFSELIAGLPTARREDPEVRLDRPAVERWRAEGKPHDAVDHLQEVIKSTPHDFGSLLLLAEIYAEEFHRVRKARRVVNRIQRQPCISPGNKALARRRLREWKSTHGEEPPSPLIPPGPAASLLDLESNSPPAAAPPADPAEVTTFMNPFSPGLTEVERLCRQRDYGTALEKLDEFQRQNPKDLKSWAVRAQIQLAFLGNHHHADKAAHRLLEAAELPAGAAEFVLNLAELYGRTPDRLPTAERLVQKVVSSPQIDLGVKEEARERLKEWKTVQFR